MKMPKGVFAPRPESKPSAALDRFIHHCARGRQWEADTQRLHDGLSLTRFGNAADSSDERGRTHEPSRNIVRQPHVINCPSQRAHIHPCETLMFVERRDLRVWTTHRRNRDGREVRESVQDRVLTA